jgi:hypothetical protein
MALAFDGANIWVTYPDDNVVSKMVPEKIQIQFSNSKGSAISGPAFFTHISNRNQ